MIPQEGRIAMSDPSTQIPDSVWLTGNANAAPPAGAVYTTTTPVPTVTPAVPTTLPPVPTAVEPPATEEPPAEATEGSLEALLDGLPDDRKAKALAAFQKTRRENAAIRVKERENAERLAALDALEANSRTDLERLEHERNTYAQQLTAARHDVARSRVEATLAGLGIADAGDIAADMDMAKFLDDSGLPDPIALASLRARYARYGNRTPLPDASQASGAAGSVALTPEQAFYNAINSI